MILIKNKEQIVLVITKQIIGKVSLQIINNNLPISKIINNLHFLKTNQIKVSVTHKVLFNHKIYQTFSISIEKINNFCKD